MLLLEPRRVSEGCRTSWIWSLPGLDAQSKEGRDVRQALQLVVALLGVDCRWNGRQVRLGTQGRTLILLDHDGSGRRGYHWGESAMPKRLAGGGRAW